MSPDLLGKIHTILGPIEPDELGRCLVHEHILCDAYRITGNVDHILNDEAMAVSELSVLKDFGCTSVVECTPEDVGRNVDGLLRVAVATGLHVVMGSGWYVAPFYPPFIDSSSTQQLADLLEKELVEGVGTSGVRPGILGEVGFNGSYATATEERVLRAVSRAQKRTGAPIYTHNLAYPTGLIQLDILEEEGVDPSRVIIGHADTYLEDAYLLAVLDRGAYLGFDCIGRNHIYPDSRRVDVLVRLLDAGWKDRLLVSSDRCFRSDLRPYGGLGYGAVLGQFFDQLRRVGVPDSVLNDLVTQNTKRILTWQAK